MPYNLRKSLSLAAVAIMTFCNLVFADTVYLKDGTKIENATVAEITKTEIKYKIGERVVLYTIPKDDAIKIVYKDGSEDVFAFEPQVEAPKDTLVNRIILFNIEYLNGLGISSVAEATKNLKYSENDYIFRYGLGLGFYGLFEDSFSWPLFFNANLGLPKGDIEYFFNNRLGTGIYGGNEDLESCFFCDVFYEPSIGVQYNNFNLSLGYNFSSYFENSFVIRAGYRLNYETKVKVNDDSSDAPKEKEKEKNSRYFRPGIEINYPVYRSEIKVFDNSFPYLAGGAGLFFRIGPENFYFTTGANYKVDLLYKEGVVSKELGIYGIDIISVPLLDLSWDRFSVEFPLLLSFGSGQIKFTGGALLDFYFFTNTVFVEVNEKVPIEGGTILISDGDTPYGDLYATFGLDIDIVRHWGVGVKCLVWGSSFGEAKEGGLYDIMGLEPSRFQTRVSTYFVF